MSTGARVGEISNLKWSELDFCNKAAIFFWERTQTTIRTLS
ncbi:hypothetical protein [Paenibacillus macerans]